MKDGVERITLAKVKARQPEWFSRGNKKFFGDVSYRVLYGKRTGEPYLVRSTYAWSAMFSGKRTLHYRVNQLHDYLEIGSLLDEVFPNLPAVKCWIKTENGIELYEKQQALTKMVVENQRKLESFLEAQSD